MIIFTPNTVIRSTEINSNFNEVDGRLDLLESPVYAYGSVASNTADGVKTLYPTASSGITFNGSNLYTVVTKGIYYIYAQQLQITGASAIYFRVDINGSAVRYGYIPGSTMTDVTVGYMGELSTGNTIRIYQQNACNSAWEGQHSSFQIFLIKRT